MCSIYSTKLTRSIQRGTSLTRLATIDIRYRLTATNVSRGARGTRNCISSGDTVAHAPCWAAKPRGTNIAPHTLKLSTKSE